MAPILIKQRDLTDCGAACLASVSANYQLKMPVAKIRQLAGTDQLGTNLSGLIAAAAKLGFEAKGVKGTLESLNKIPLPAIAHVIVQERLHHYVVIYKVRKNKLSIMDPMDGKMHTLTFESFTKEWTNVLMILLPDRNFKVANEQVANSIRFYQLIKPHRKVILQALFGAVVYTLLALATSIFIQKITDHVLVDGNRSLLTLMSLAMIGILGFQSFIGTIKNIFVMRIGQQIDARLILAYYKHLLKLPQQFFDTMRVGEIISRVNDAVKIRAFINDIAINLTVNIFIIFFSFALMFSYYWKLALLLLLVIPFYLAIYFVTNRLNKKIQRKLMEQSAQLESQLVESMRSISTIKRIGIEEFTNEKTGISFIRLLKTVYRSNLNSMFSTTATEVISKLLTIILLWKGASLVIGNEISPGELFSFYTLINYFTAPVSALIGANKLMQDATIASDRLFEIMDLEVEQDNASIELGETTIGDIHFENVTFSYGTRKIIFQNLNLLIKARKFTAIVGESGSGKSTLLALLQQIYTVQDGKITIGNYQIKQIKNSSLRKTIGMVPQTIDLFTGNVIENIAIGDANPSMEQIVKICTQLGILNFIENLPNGFQTYLGENGMALSGGEKQRIAIARALYRQPEILILDEATSSLDSTSENYIRRTIELLMAKQKTVIVIAHRLATVRNADEIIVMHNGQVVEQGKHAQLLAQNGKYRQLYQQQYDVV